MMISPRFSDREFTELKLAVQSGAADWRKAISIFEDRIQGRFLRWIDRINRSKYSGFAVLALDCLLAETLQAFKEGKLSTKKETTKVFIRFLQESDSLKPFFHGDTAKKFHEHVRSRIMHHGDTTSGWKIIRGSSRPMLVHQAKGVHIVSRLKFHRAIIAEFKYYTRLLRTGRGRPDDMVNFDDLRQKFITKMESICRSGIPE